MKNAGNAGRFAKIARPHISTVVAATRGGANFFRPTPTGREVLDQDVLNLLFQVKREDFVPLAYRAIAFTDMEIPLGEGQFMMAPKMEARIVQELAPGATERVLEVGTGSGYLTALLASRAAAVTSIEYFESAIWRL